MTGMAQQLGHIKHMPPADNLYCSDDCQAVLGIHVVFQCQQQTKFLVSKLAEPNVSAPEPTEHL